MLAALAVLAAVAYVAVLARLAWRIRQLHNADRRRTIERVVIERRIARKERRARPLGNDFQWRNLR